MGLQIGMRILFICSLSMGLSPETNTAHLLVSFCRNIFAFYVQLKWIIKSSHFGLGCGQKLQCLNLGNILKSVIF